MHLFATWRPEAWLGARPGCPTGGPQLSVRGCFGGTIEHGRMALKEPYDASTLLSACAGTLRDGEGCNTFKVINATAAPAELLKTGFNCLCAKAGTIVTADNGKCPATHDQRGVCITALDTRFFKAR